MTERIPTVDLPFELSETFSQSGSEPLPDQWWLSFEDPALNEIIDEAIGNNLTIQSAWDRLSQAEQTAIKAGAGLLPSATYSGEAERSYIESGSRGSYDTAYSAGAAAAYEIDLWGRVRSTHQAAVLDAVAARENVQAATITLSSSAAVTWYRLAEAKLQAELITEQIQTNEQVLQIITAQFRQGLIGAADVFRQRQLIQSTKGQLIQAHENIVLLQHQLSVLLGRNPQTWWRENVPNLVTPGSLPDTGIPSEILQRRPDVVSAYNEVAAADYRLAAAMADQYPRISITANAQTSADRAKDLFDDWLGNLAANAAGPLFDAGFRRAEAERTRAVLSQAIHEYAQTSLNAIREVEDALNQEQYQRQFIDNLRQQLAHARRVYERSYQNYLKGNLDYLRVLDSLISQQLLERSELTARRVLVERRIDLYRSIAGRWELERPPLAAVSTDETKTENP